MILEVKQFETAPMLWARVLEENGIAAITGAWYPSYTHGVEVVNRGALFRTKEVSADLRKGIVPGGDQIFAIGSIAFGRWCKALSDTKIEARKSQSPIILSTSNPIRSVGPQLSFLKDVGSWKPSSPLQSEIRSNPSRQYFVLLDFECEVDELNQQRIIEVLKLHPKDWSLLISDGSYHVVFESTVCTHFSLIQEYGRIIKMFTLAAQNSLSHIFTAFGDDFEHGAEEKVINENFPYYSRMEDEARVVVGCNAILTAVSHINKPVREGLTFILDLRHMAHTILDLIKANHEGTDRLGVLRITTKPGYDRPPLVIARKRGKRLIQYKTSENLYDRKQLRLKGI